MFIAALFTAARTWKQPRRSSTDEWMKMWYVYRASLVAQLIKNPPATHETLVQFWGQEEPSLERDRLPTLPGGSDSKESACNVGPLCFIPGLGRSPGRGHATHSSILALENLHGQRSLVGYSPWGHKESDMGDGILLSHYKE